jgi:hypothetical protein
LEFVHGNFPESQGFGEPFKILHVFALGAEEMRD